MYNKSIIAAFAASIMLSPAGFAQKKDAGKQSVPVSQVASRQAQQKNAASAKGVKPGELGVKIITHQEPAQGARNLYGPYSPDMNSLRAHKCPEWFRDAKFGMFIDWGLYSVIGYAEKKGNTEVYADWSNHHMLQPGATQKFVVETFGKDFQPDDCIPLFTAENYQPEKLIQLAAEAGMKYVVPFCKCHDGYCLWPSSYTGRNSVDMTPHRDLIRPLADESLRLGLKFGFYFSVEDYCMPMMVNGEKKERRWSNWSGEALDKNGCLPWNPANIKKNMSGKYFIDGDFFTDYIVPQAKEFIDMYDPDILWFDGEWDMSPEQLHTPDIISYFYNNAEGRKEVAVNDRIGRVRFQFGDFYCSEFHKISEQLMLAYPWEENRSLCTSYGYNRLDTEADVQTTDEFVDMLVRTVSHNGNLLLMIAPDGTGALPEFIERRLREIGAWLKVNGEAIYNSRPCQTPEQDGGKVRFTQSKDGKTMYAICTEFPKDKLVLQKLLYLGKSSKVTMLGADGAELKWRHVSRFYPGGGNQHDLEITIPDGLYEKRKNEYAWVFKITL